MIDFIKQNYKEILNIAVAVLDFFVIILMIWWIKLLNKIWRKGE